MEIRANYVLIGVFSIVCVFAAFLFVLLLAKQQFDLEYSYYEILFDGDVSGLSVGAEVRYNGISVGEVRTIKLHPEDPGKVSVVIQVSADTPVREDSVAYLEAQLLTGVSIVQISGGSPDSPALVAKPGQRYAIIQSGKSSLQELFTGAPDLIAKANILVERLADIVDTENRESISKTLKNVEVLTSAFADNSEELEAMLKNLSAASEDIASLTEQLDTLAKTANDILDEDARVLISEASQAARNFSTLAENLDDVVVENEDAIADFSQQGLAQLGRLVTEARQLVSTLDRVATRIESDPAAFFFGNQAAEFEPR